MEGALGSWTLVGALPAARAIHDAALTLLFGGLLFPLYALPKDARAPTPRMLAWLRGEAWVALASAAAVFLLGLAAMAGSFSAAIDPALLWQTLTGGEYGWLFLARAALLLACGLVLARGRGGAAAAWLSGAALAALALTGHAREGEGLTMQAHVALDALHLLCAGLWIGGLPWFARILASGYPAEGGLKAVRRFSAVAAWAVAALLLSGAGATLLLVGTPLALLGTLWGRLLLAKIALALAMVAFAAHNRWRLTPALADHAPGAPAALRRNARVELTLALVVLALVGLIGTLPFERM